jgi:hypothetical protein
MSFRSDPVVVPFAVFSERRARRTRVATALREHDRRDVAVQRPLAAAVAVIVARGRAPSAATEECK